MRLSPRAVPESRVSVNDELLALDVEEPETWSETADKKLLKKMHSKDIKRQDTIWGTHCYVGGINFIC